MMIYLISALVFVAGFLIVFLVVYLVSRSSDPVRKRLKHLQEGEKAKGERAIPILPLEMGSERVKATRVWLAQAGYRKPQSVSNYYGGRLLCGLILGLVSLFLTLYFYPRSPEMLLLGAVVGTLIGAYIPKVWVFQKASRRREQIRRSVPNMLDLMVVCVEAGLSLNAAIQKIAQESRNSHPALGEELHLVNQEILVGKTREEAFRNLARRTGVEDLRSLAVMLIQADKLGVSIGNSLRVLADSVRTKRAQSAEEAAHKISVKLVFPLVLLIFPELLVILLGPALITLFRTLSDIAAK